MKLMCAVLGHDWTVWTKTKFFNLTWGRYRRCRRCGMEEWE